MRNTRRTAEFCRIALDTREAPTSPVHFYRLADVVSHFEDINGRALSRGWDKLYCAARDAKASQELLCALHSVEDDIMEREERECGALDADCDIEIHEDCLYYLEEHLEEMKALIETAHPEDAEALGHAVEALSHLREDLIVPLPEVETLTKKSEIIDLQSERNARTVDEHFSPNKRRAA